MSNDDWMQKNVYQNDVYKKFLDGTLYQSIDVLSSEDLLNADLSEGDD